MVFRHARIATSHPLSVLGGSSIRRCRRPGDRFDVSCTCRSLQSALGLGHGTDGHPGHPRAAGAADADHLRPDNRSRAAQTRDTNGAANRRFPVRQYRRRGLLMRGLVRLPGRSGRTRTRRLLLEPPLFLARQAPFLPSGSDGKRSLEKMTTRSKS